MQHGHFDALRFSGSSSRYSGSIRLLKGPDPVVGTWVLNVAKSKFSPGPAPKSNRACMLRQARKSRRLPKAWTATGSRLPGNGQLSTTARTEH